MREIREETGNDGSRYRPGVLPAARKLAGKSDPATNVRHDRRGERTRLEATSHPHVPHFGK